MIERLVLLRKLGQIRRRHLGSALRTRDAVERRVVLEWDGRLFHPSGHDSVPGFLDDQNELRTGQWLTNNYNL